MVHLFKTILRNFYHNRLYTVINLVGLAFGLACFTFILLFVLDELSFDKHHNAYKQIYRLESDITVSGKNQKVAKSSFAIGPALKREFPEVEEFVRFRPIDNCFLRYGNKQFYEDLLYYADSTVFDVFDHTFIQGSTKNALTRENSIVLTRRLAEKYFGNNEAVGKVINLGNKINCKVTAVIEDVPGNSHLKFEGLVSMVSYSQIIGKKMYYGLDNIHFWAIRLFSYIKLKEGTSIDQIHEKFPSFHDKYILDISKKMNGSFKLLTTRLDKIHLFSSTEWDLPKGDIRTVVIISFIAIIIILIAAINYMNLATARYTQRAKEVGIRKLLGAYRTRLARLLISESMVLALIALVIAAVIVESFLPYINRLFERELIFKLSQTPEIFMILLVVTLFIGFFSGSYPAFYLSSFRPVVVLRGMIRPGRNSGRLRKLLIVFQFTISIAMIIATFIVSRQMNYIRERDLGFKKENLLVIRSTDTTFKKKIEDFKNKLLGIPDIYNVATSTTVPGAGNYMDIFLVEGKEKMEEQLISFMWVDYNFLDVMGMKLIKGRKFDQRSGTDLEHAAIINWRTAEKLGWKENALGKKIHQRSDKTYEYQVIGVIEDINFNPLYQEAGPFIFLLEKQPQDVLTIRINPGKQHETIAKIESLWSTYNPGEPFKYDFLVDIINQNYLADEKLKQIITWFAFFSVFISLLGLFGLSSFITERYSKNIGIRKLLGASVGSIIQLLSGDFLKLILIAFVLATPLAWYAMDRWLSHFVYRIDIEIIWFVLTGLLVLAFAQVTVITQTIKSALTNPVDVIRYE